MKKRLLILVLACVLLCAACVLPEGEGTRRDDTTETVSTEEGTSEKNTTANTEPDSREESETNQDVIPEVTTREKVTDGFPNEAESSGTKRY